MKEILRVFVQPFSHKKREFEKWISDVEALGVEIDRGRWVGISDAVDVIMAPDDSRPIALCEAAVREGVLKKWQRSNIEQSYTSVEIASSKLFSFVHVGRSINIPQGKDDILGISHITTYDLRDACSECGSGAVQQSGLHVPASELKKCGSFASLFIVSNEFVMTSKSLLDDLAISCRESIESRTVIMSGSSKGERWDQLDPSWTFPIEACSERRYSRIGCAECGAIRLQQDDLLGGGQIIVKEHMLSRLKLPPVMLSPYWDGVVERFEDGRLISVPSRRMWFRADLAHHLSRARIRGLELTPLLSV
jgi:hypothetical protein